MSCSISAAVVFFAAVAVGVDDEPFRKKVIACSWDFGNFTVADVLSNKAAVAALPVDGVRLSAIGPTLPDGRPLTPWTAFSGTNDWPEGVLSPLVPQFREAMAIPSMRCLGARMPDSTSGTTPDGQRRLPKFGNWPSSRVTAGSRGL